MSDLLPQESTVSPNEITVHVRMTSTGDTHTYTARPSETIARFIDVISESQDYRDRYVRLVFNGRLLEPMQTLTDVGIGDGSVVHCVVSDHVPQHHQQRTALPHMSGADGGDDDGSDDGRPRGFDRLVETGLSEEDVELMRRQFYAHRHHLLRGNYSPNELRRIEDEWIDNEASPDQGSEEGMDASAMGRDGDEGMTGGMMTPQQRMPEGTNMEMFYGIILGFLLGFLTIILLAENAVSRKQKTGVLIGLCCNVWFSCLLLLLSFELQ
eukprot:gb/GECH01000497.1/.p1 GENE.gb/GECH01000497.1/~~gb/GECH01000497.1/.p1  ORF type:complete len:268 (+),score=55.80 gb/GECH01000497.1/:1-804(+)